jgi:molybdopterin-guanine dinucleotide biosynthesis protein A
LFVAMADIDGFILAGGKSSRMGKDKANLLLGEKTLVEHAASALTSVTRRVFIVGDVTGNPPGIPILRDRYKIGNGPQKRGAMIGMHAALVEAATAWSAVLACDLPFVSGALWTRIISFEREDFDAVVPVQADGKPQPLCALYRSDACLPVIGSLLGTNDWSLQGLLRTVRTRFIGFEDVCDLSGASHFFSNINTPEDYAAAKAILKTDS